ncbi:MAG: hypothetical protein Q8Q25_02285 [bacterium]|nr:hypothetical protein [bacterium]
MKIRAFLLYLSVLLSIVYCPVQAMENTSSYAMSKKAQRREQTREHKKQQAYTSSTTTQQSSSSTSSTQPTISTSAQPLLLTPSQAQQTSSSSSSSDKQNTNSLEQEVQQPGWGWSFCTRESRVKYALSHPLDPGSRAYLASQDGEHEIGRVLLKATEQLQANNLTEENDVLITIQTILEKCRELGIAISLTEFRSAWAKVKTTKTGVIGNLNKRLQEKRDQFTQELNKEFSKEAKLIARLARIQHAATDLRKRLADDPQNTSDTEAKKWSPEQVFEVLSGINQPKKDGTFRTEITLQPTAPEDEEKDKDRS